MAVVMDTVFTLTARGASPSITVSLMAQAEWCLLRKTLETIAILTLAFPAQSLQHQLLRLGLDAKGDNS